MNAETNPLLDAALALAVQGVKVFPCHRVVDGECTCHDQGCKSPGKHPRTKNGSKDATTDERQIREWWTKYGKHGRLNFGQTLAGRAVVDVDVAEGKPGEAQWAALSDGQGTRDTLTYRTGRGGVQYVYRLPAGEVGGKENGYGPKLASAVDFKTGPNAYVMVPGSKTVDVYTVIADDPTALLPEWITAVARTIEPYTIRASDGSKVSVGGCNFWGMTLVDLDAIPVDDDRRGNNWLTAVAGHVANMHPDKPDVVRMVCSLINGKSTEPISTHDFDKTVNSVLSMEAAKQAGTDGVPDSFTNGASFFQNVPDVPPAVWGSGTEVLWAEGEALQIAAPQGVGKTTVAMQLVRALGGLQGTVLGFPVKPRKKVLYLAMDRPQQAARAGNRVFAKDDPERLTEYLTVWQGPPRKDLALYPEELLRMCQDAGADTVIVDSVKDAAVGLSKDEVGAGWNRARQIALQGGVEVLELHHMVKNGADGKAPDNINGVYGSTWITSGTGSVILLWGEAGDPVVQFRHLKQPVEEVGPFHLIHDHTTGVTSIQHAADLVQLVKASPKGITALDAAKAMFETDKPDRNQKEKARRKLAKLVTSGVLVEAPGSAKEPTVYRMVSDALFD
ncbi:bifunctional DNA primase/polymerase [Streptomyces olivaceus]|uniref:bifunctional DNA primase/polymerase n=1 Tax=Streptomyces olivaceus TaxID=47716 RepID=UPI001CCF8E33|nr:bifunctional DNA primase/polymerase [Streptomyces olivaceus]MBZ6252184.1 bifunctional DNA primase/polymerase [Streptomyces olivaceus]